MHEVASPPEESVPHVASSVCPVPAHSVLRCRGPLRAQCVARRRPPTTERRRSAALRCVVLEREAALIDGSALRGARVMPRPLRRPVRGSAAALFRERTERAAACRRVGSSCARSRFSRLPG